MARLSRFFAIVALSTVACTLPAVAHGAASDVYVVRNGDSLSAIATRLGVRLPELLRANDLTVTSLIFPGQRLDVPGSAGGSSATSGSYTVRRGDSLSAIAARHSVTLGALLTTNNLTMTSLIHPGQRLQIPGGTGGSTGGAATTGNYTVRSGDSLSAIAARHSVTLGALLTTNNLTMTSLIHPGQRLQIPGGTGGSTSGAATTGNYTVRAGDSLSAIAARHSVTLGALLTTNNLTMTSLIHPGQRLQIPGGTGGSTGGSPGGAAGGSAGDYTVRSGDSLGAIAERYGVTLAALLDANGLTASSIIHPGSRLTLPAGAKVSATERVVNYALAQLGKPYKFFTRGPTTYDCSGLTLAAYAQIGIPLIHHSASQARRGTAVDFTSEPILAGDLVFMRTNGSRVINHVGIAVSSTTWVQARRPGDVVRLASLPPDSLIAAVRRLVPAD